ncbi:site-specific integrase [Mesorhizobium sp. IMUNJ 23232]|uniref:site-specific integrase n=1 Tax=Mesorhizobium sp. IMUNJ 23232 TaxID=3376064 RepID=UPI0037ADEC96
MKYVHWLPKRGEYLVRIIVPPELRGIIGQRELGGRLGADKRIAEKNAHSIIARDLARIEEARERLKAIQPTLSTAAKAHYRAELETDAKERLRDEDVLIGLRQVTQRRRASLLRLVAAGQIVGEEADALIGYAADALHRKGIAPDVPRATLLKALAEAQLDAMAQIEARDKGMLITPEPKSALLTQPDPEPAISPEDRGTGSTLSDILTAFHRERTSGARTLAQKTMDEHKSAVRMFDEFIGAAVPARSITRKDVLAYKQTLLRTPARYTLRFPGLTLPQSVKANEKLKEPFDTLDPKTINFKWLSHLSSIFKWGMNNGFLDDNPAAGVRVDEGKGFKEPTRVPFSQDDLVRIFSGEPFKLPRAGWSTRQWALLIALYTGARSSSEIARIRLADIYQEQGVDVINLALASKNVRSKRLVPIHQHLIDLGFLDYVKRMREKGQTRLFPDWEPEDKINRWFLRTYMAEVGINDDRKVFHSFRHSLKTALARYGVNRDVSDLITGHKDQSVGGVYIGDASVTMVQAMADGLNRVDFKLPVAPSSATDQPNDH